MSAEVGIRNLGFRNSTRGTRSDKNRFCSRMLLGNESEVALEAFGKTLMAKVVIIQLQAPEESEKVAETMKKSTNL